jgi:hypothetical protein
MEALGVVVLLEAALASDPLMVRVSFSTRTSISFRLTPGRSARSTSSSSVS